MNPVVGRAYSMGRFGEFVTRSAEVLEFSYEILDRAYFLPWASPS